MYKKNFFLIIFFTFLSIFSLVKLYDHAATLATFEYGEWLINYQHGFVRRGLIGEIIYLFSNLFNNNIQITFFIILAFVCLIYYFLNYIFIKDIKHNFLYSLVIFSPLFYLFFVVISKVGIRKEIIFYIFYLLYLLHLSSKNFQLNKNWKFIFIFPLLLLNHESIFFYLPYVILPLLFLVKKEDLKNLIFQTFALIILSSFVMLFLYAYKGTEEHTINICQSLGNYAPIKCDWWGPIAALRLDLLKNIENQPLLFFYLSASYKTWLGFVFYILYGFIPFFIYLRFVNVSYSNLLINKEFLFFTYSAILGFSLPLFHIAEDWTRWFSIHFHLLAFLIFFLQKIKLVDFENNLKFNKISDYFFNPKIKKMFIILVLLYGTSFHHHHFFFQGVKLEFTYYKIFKKIKHNF